MEQVHDILINRYFTGSTSATTPISIQSNLQYENQYYYNPTGTADIIVDYSNVRAFLTNENNQKFVKAYYSFLTASPLMNSALLIDQNTSLFTPTSLFKATYYDDEKLAESFNNFYNSSILRGINSKYSENPDIFNTSVRNQFLPDENRYYSAQSIFHNYYFWQSPNPINPAYSPPKNPFFTAGTPYYTTPVLDIYGGDRDESVEERLVEVSTDKENYYVNVLLLKRFTQSARMAFEVCNSVIYKEINASEIFSQNSTDISRYNDYSNSANITITTSLDKSPVVALQDTQQANLQQQITTKSLLLLPIQTGKTLIQCFVDPNFKTNENEYWKDSPINVVNFQYDSYFLSMSGTVGVVVYLQQPAEKYMSVGVRITNETTYNYEYNTSSPFEDLQSLKYTTVFFNPGESQKTIYFNNNYSDCQTAISGTTINIPINNILMSSVLTASTVIPNILNILPNSAITATQEQIALEFSQGITSATSMVYIPQEAILTAVTESATTAITLTNVTGFTQQSFFNPTGLTLNLSGITNIANSPTSIVNKNISLILCNTHGHLTIGTINSTNIIVETCRITI